MTELSRLLWC